MLVPIILFCCGLFAGTKINPAFGLLILGGTYVVDFAISNSIVVSGGLDMDRFPMNIEAIAYGVIGLGWMISGTISAINRDNAAIDRAEEERL
ncbi:hypothetical protein CH337_21455 [Rhodoblastus acidophilus]|nr:hypothetical protein CKO16_20150 [Rhodoblastus acidophilus]RAI16418.1 hypothetical protein CH337_21455 [Rhodoblastus acidophilus]